MGNNLANLHCLQNQAAAAEPLYRRSLAIREKALGEDHAEVASSLYRLGRLYVDQARHTEAEPLLRRCRTIREKIALGYRVGGASVPSRCHG